MSKIIEFTGEMFGFAQAPKSGAVAFPFDLMETFGKKSVKVKMTFDGVAYRGLLKSMGGEGVWCLIRKDIRAEIGKNPGDLVHVTVQEDTEERVVDVPLDFQRILNEKPEVQHIFDKLSYTSRKEYVAWIESAKRPETRERRLNQSVEILLAGKKDPRGK